MISRQLCAALLAAVLAVLVQIRPAVGQDDGDAPADDAPAPAPDDEAAAAAVPAIVPPSGPPSADDLVPGEDISFGVDDLDELEHRLAELARIEVAATAHVEALIARGDDAARSQRFLIATYDAGERGRFGLVTALRKALAGDGNLLLAPRAAELLAALYDQLAEVTGARERARNAEAYARAVAAGTLGDDEQVYNDDASGASFGLALGWRWAAITQRRWLIDTFPDYAGRGRALLAVSESYDDEGYDQDARATLQLYLCGNRKAEIDASKDGDDAIARGIYARVVGLTDYDGCTPAGDDRDVVADAWIRLAQMHQATTAEADLAVAALTRATADPRASAYLEALRQLADVQMARGAMFDAISPLDELAIRVDSRPPDDDARAQRHWAVNDLGRIIALLWRQSSLPDPDGALNLARIYFHAGRNQQPHVRDVFQALGNALVQFGAIDQAATVYRHVVATWPLEISAPQASASLIDVLVQKGDTEGADNERLAAAQRFGRDAKWRDSHGDRADAVKLVAEALWAVAQARYHDAEVRAASGGGGGRGARANAPITQQSNVGPSSPTSVYDAAKATFTQYLTEMPSGGHAEEARFRIAQLDAFAGRHVEAARAMRAVRDQGSAHGRFYEGATRAMVAAYRAALAEAAAAGTQSLPAVPDAHALADGTASIEMPAMVREARAAFDDFAASVAFGDEAAAALLDAALLDLRFRHADDARTRLRTLLGTLCQTPAGKLARGHLDALAGEGGKGRAAIAELEAQCTAAEKTRRDGLRQRYAEAEQLYKDGKSEESVRAFYAIYRAAPTDFELADDALYWSAYLLRDSGRLRGALQLLDEFVHRDELASSDLYAAALWLRAEAHHAAFDYERAASEYLELHTLSKGKRKLAAAPGFDPARSPVTALRLAAESREMDHFYYDRDAEPGAATLFQRYAVEVRKDAPAASSAYSRAAQIYQRAGDAASTAKVYEQWKARHGKAGLPEYGIELAYSVALASDQTGDRRAARVAYAEVVAIARSRGAPLSDQGARAQLWLGEDLLASAKLAEFSWGSGTSEQELGKVMDAYGKRVEPVMRAFEAVGEFDTRWNVAALVRQGEVRRTVVETILAAPIPPAFFSILKLDEAKLAAMSPEERVRYAADALHDELTPFLTEAGILWQKAIAEADRRYLVDHWSRRARRDLAETFPERSLEVMSDEILVSEEEP